eukprot:Clim_evm62s136 gene=Clim_evmTU62s136
MDAVTNMSQHIACRNCGRNFFPERISKHESVCSNANRPRSRYDSTRHRIYGTQIIGYAKLTKLGTVVPVRSQSPERKDWRHGHEELVATIRSAREHSNPNSPSTSTRGLANINTSSSAPRVRSGRPSSAAQRQRTAEIRPPIRPSVRPGTAQCAYCGRNFNEDSAKRHIVFCAEQQKRITVQNKKKEAAQQKLKARTQYQAPSPRGSQTNLAKSGSKDRLNNSLARPGSVNDSASWANVANKRNAVPKSSSTVPLKPRLVGHRNYAAGDDKKPQVGRPTAGKKPLNATRQRAESAKARKEVTVARAQSGASSIEHTSKHKNMGHRTNGDGTDDSGGALRKMTGKLRSNGSSKLSEREPEKEFYSYSPAVHQSSEDTRTFKTRAAGYLADAEAGNDPLVSNVSEIFISEPTEMVTCPHCDRSFVPSSAERHIRFCAEQQKRMKNRAAAERTRQKLIPGGFAAPAAGATQTKARSGGSNRANNAPAEVPSQTSPTTLSDAVVDDHSPTTCKSSQLQNDMSPSTETSLKNFSRPRSAHVGGRHAENARCKPRLSVTDPEGGSTDEDDLDQFESAVETTDDELRPLGESGGSASYSCLASFCFHCGERFVENANFCSQCGTKRV